MFLDKLPSSSLCPLLKNSFIEIIDIQKNGVYLKYTTLQVLAKW